MINSVRKVEVTRPPITVRAIGILSSLPSPVPSAIGSSPRQVVAEGVENEDQLTFLHSLGCTYVQGLLFGEPMSSDNYLELLLAQAEGTDSYRALFA